MAERMMKGYAIVSKPYDNGSWYYSTPANYEGHCWVNDSREAVLFLNENTAYEHARHIGLGRKEFETVAIYREINDAA